MIKKKQCEILYLNTHHGYFVTRHNNGKIYIVGRSVLLENDSLLNNQTKPDINCPLNIVNNYREHYLTKSYRAHRLTKSSEAQLANRLYRLITRNIHFTSNNVHSAGYLLSRRFSITRHHESLFNNIHVGTCRYGAQRRLYA